MSHGTKQRTAADCRALIEHVARYRLTVPREAADALGQTLKSTRRRLANAVRDGQLGIAPLYRNRRYYYLTPSGAESAGAPRHGPLGEAAKARAYAMLRFCRSDDASRQRLTAEDLQEHFRELYRPGMSGGYYVDTSDGRWPRIGLLRVDFGGRGRWDRIVQRVRRDIEAHATERGFRPLLARQALEMAVVTALPQKAARIRQALAAHRDARRIPVRVIAMPDLLHLVMPPSVATDQTSFSHLTKSKNSA